MAAKKRMSNREKQERARIKKELQKDGILPPDKKPLNRRKFVEEAVEEWNARQGKEYIWPLYLNRALSYVLAQQEGRSGRVSLEAVGAAKILKTAIRLREFSVRLKEEGREQYKLSEEYEAVKDILEA